MLAGILITAAAVLAVALISGGRGLDFGAREVNLQTERLRATHR